ncbi:MAG: hypothetical protein H0X39_15650 [Actinobacteria bacterium]|nr:hypothetical protein [Actinomycetota bacterium]
MTPARTFHIAGPINGDDLLRLEDTSQESYWDGWSCGRRVGYRQGYAAGLAASPSFAVWLLALAVAFAAGAAVVPLIVGVFG